MSGCTLNRMLVYLSLYPNWKWRVYSVDDDKWVKVKLYLFTGSSWWRPRNLEEVCRAESTQEPGKPWNNFVVGVFYNLDNKIWKYQNTLITLYFTHFQHKFSMYIIYAVNWILNLLECQGLSGASPSFALRAFASSISSWSLDPVALSRDLDLCLRLQSILESTFKVQTETRNMIWFDETRIEYVMRLCSTNVHNE